MYSSGNSYSSPEEIEQVQEKSASKPTTPKEKPSKGKSKKAQQTKESDSFSEEKATGGKKKQKKTKMASSHSKGKSFTERSNGINVLVTN